MNGSISRGTKNNLKDAERHAKILAKIEKYKEDKILQELEVIEREKQQMKKLIRMKREQEKQRKAYIGKLLIKTKFLCNLDNYELFSYKF